MICGDFILLNLVVFFYAIKSVTSIVNLHRV